MSEIKVHVTKYSDRKYLVLRYTDPVSGNQKTRSAKTISKRDAERAAARWEADLRAGRYVSPNKLTWEDFRERYETEYVRNLSDSGARNVYTTLDAVERIIAPRRLADLTSGAISEWIGELRDEGSGRKDTTVALYCRVLKAALNWAIDVDLLAKAPKIRAPRIPAGAKLMRGRPLTGEEHDRMLATVPKVVKAVAHVEPYQRLIVGLWTSGLRIGEALAVSWDQSAAIAVMMQPGYRPALRFRSHAQKARRDELWTCPPEFAELLTSTPEKERVGPVFKIPKGRHRGSQVTPAYAGLVISAIGRRAKILTDPEEGRFATAHDYRRSFGSRWANRLKPNRLKQLMRHKDINTTMRFYVQDDAADFADELWSAYEYEKSNTLGNSQPEKGVILGV